MNVIKKITDKFHARSFKHLLIIFLVFALSGSASLLMSSSILNEINLKELIKFYPLYLLVRIIFLIPIYQLVLITSYFNYLINLNRLKNFFSKFQK